WPYGRGNHFLFDMNRDWLWGTQHETRARWTAIRKYKPQLLVDAHEMGGLDTYLFYPATDPLTPNFSRHTLKWWPVFAADQAGAFDRYGWSYYTREWADSWYPGYTDSWGSYQGAVGILYEQARFHGQALRRA
ncbi:MAG: peptidase, partial [Planctomycetia bacterium]